MEFEVEIIKFLQAGRSGFADITFQVITYLGSIYAALLFFVILLIVKRDSCLWFAGAFGLSYGVAFLLKHIIKRVRPFAMFEGITCIGEVESGYSFPSGHSVVITCIAIFLAFLLLRRFKKVWQRILIVLGVCLVESLVLVSRMYLGVHYLSDLIAGVAIGAILTTASLLIWHFYNKKRKEKNEVKDGN